MRLGSQKRYRKAFKRVTRDRDERVLNVKPYPIPDLEGQAARVFERQIREPPTHVQKRMMEEGVIVYSRTKRRK
jgi:hypothetical protein